MNIDPINEDSLKYNTCKFKSEEKISQLIKRCACKGGDQLIEGYICYERDIFDVKPDTCKNCESYQSK